MEIGPLTQTITIAPIPITGNADFDYFFTLVFVFGAIGYYFSSIVAVLRGSR